MLRFPNTIYSSFLIPHFPPRLRERNVFFNMVNLKKNASEEGNAQVIPISAITKRLEKYKNYTNLPFIEKLPIIVDLMLDNQYRDNIQKIYLFGSYAYGEPNEDSDIDFFVIIDDSILSYRRDVYFNIEKKLCKAELVPNDLLVYNENTFNQQKNMTGIERIVNNYGVIIYERR